MARNPYHASFWVPTKAWHLLLLAVLAGLVLRLLYLDSKSLWLDEARSLTIAQAGIAALWAGNGELYHPPLYYLLVEAWSQFGDSVFMLRLSSALLGSAAIPLIYAVARGLGPADFALSAAWLAALSPLLIWYSQEFRSYALLVVLGLVVAVSLIHLLVKPSWTWWLLFTAAMTAAFYTHYVAVLLAPAQLLLAVTLYVQGRVQRRGLVYWFAAVPVVFALYVPWLQAPAFTAFLDLAEMGRLYSGEMVAARLGVASTTAMGLVAAGLAAFVLAGVAVAFLLLRYGRSAASAVYTSRSARRVLLLLVVILLIASVIPRGYSLKRLMVVLWPFALLGVAWFWPWRARARLPLALLLGTSLLAALVNIVWIPKDQWRETVAYCRDHRQPNDAVWIVPLWHGAVFDYYGEGTVPLDRVSPGMTGEQLAALLGERERVWLIQVPRDLGNVDPERRLEGWLSAHFRAGERLEFYQIQAALYTREP